MGKDFNICYEIWLHNSPREWPNLKGQMGFSIWKFQENLQLYPLSTKYNEEQWSMNVVDKVAFNLPRNFDKNLCDTIAKFMGTKPIFKPPHVKDQA